MATDYLKLRPRTMTGTGALSRWMILLIIFFVSAGLFLLNYWLGLALLFLGLLLFVIFGFSQMQGRNLFLLLLGHFFVIMIGTNLVYPFLANSAAAQQMAATNDIANALWGTELAAFLTAILISVIVALVLVSIPFFFILSLVTLVVVKWYTGEGISHTQAFSHVVRSVLGIGPFSVEVVGGELKGDDDELKRLEILGGPGWLIVHSGYVVVLHRHGRITRAIGQGSKMLEHEEKIKAILSLTPSGGTQEIKNVLTRDKISLNLVVLHAARLEPAADTEARLQEAVQKAEAKLEKTKTDENASREQIETAEQAVESARQELKDLEEKDKKIGDDYDQVYESIAKLAGMRTSGDLWGTVRFPIANNIKDAFMSEYAEDVFGIGQGDGKLETRIDLRKMKEIEDFVKEKSIGAGLAKGVRLLVVDINDVRFPKDVENKVNEEVGALIDARIQKTVAQAEELAAQHKAEARRVEAESKETAARFEARAKFQLAQADVESRAEYYRRITRVLQDQGLQEETIRAVLQRLATSSALEDELRQMRQLVNRVVGSGGDQQKKTPQQS